MWYADTSIRVVEACSMPALPEDVLSSFGPLHGCEQWVQLIGPLHTARQTKFCQCDVFPSGRSLQKTKFAILTNTALSSSVTFYRSSVATPKPTACSTARATEQPVATVSTPQKSFNTFLIDNHRLITKSWLLRKKNRKSKNLKKFYHWRNKKN